MKQDTSTTRPVMASFVERMDRLKAIATSIGLRMDWISRLRQIENYMVVIVCDDSGSMRSSVNSGSFSDSPFDPRRSRWDELKETVSLIVDILGTLLPEGVDIYGLNRPGVPRATHRSQLEAFFARPPDGNTPAVAQLNQVFRDKAPFMTEKKLLVILATDGQPSEGVVAFDQCLRSRPVMTHVSILACTDDQLVVDWLDQVDKSISGVDVIDDWMSEAQQIRKVQGPEFLFSRADHAVKIILGAIDSYFDQLDERRIVTSAPVPTQVQAPVPTQVQAPIPTQVQASVVKTVPYYGSRGCCVVS